MTWILRAILVSWGVAFTLVGVRGVLNPEVFTNMFGIIAQGPAANSLRADFGAFFLVSGLGAIWGAVRSLAHPQEAKALWVPAALFGAALLHRIIGVLMGDPVTPAITQAMLAEAGSVLLMLFSQRYLGRPSV